MGRLNTSLLRRPWRVNRDEIEIETSGGPRFDRLVHMTSPALWAGVIGFLLLASSAAVWTVRSTLATEVAATGFFVHGDGPYPAVTDVSGAVSAVSVTPGDPVSRGDVVAEVRGDDGDTYPIKAPVGGRVAAIRAGPGTTIAPGAEVIAIDPVDEPLAAIVLIETRSSTAAITPGMDVSIDSDVGTFGGTVVRTEQYPISATELQRRFGAALPDTDGERWVIHVAVEAQIAGAGAAPLSPAESAWMPALLPLSASVTVDERHPYQVLFDAR